VETDEEGRRAESEKSLFRGGKLELYSLLSIFGTSLASSRRNPALASSCALPSSFSSSSLFFFFLQFALSASPTSLSPGCRLFDGIDSKCLPLDENPVEDRC